MATVPLLSNATLLTRFPLSLRFPSRPHNVLLPFGETRAKRSFQKSVKTEEEDVGLQHGLERRRVVVFRVRKSCGPCPWTRAILRFEFFVCRSAEAPPSCERVPESSPEILVEAAVDKRVHGWVGVTQPDHKEKHAGICDQRSNLIKNRENKKFYAIYIFRIYQEWLTWFFSYKLYHI